QTLQLNLYPLGSFEGTVAVRAWRSPPPAKGETMAHFVYRRDRRTGRDGGRGFVVEADEPPRDVGPRHFVGIQPSFQGPSRSDLNGRFAEILGGFAQKGGQRHLPPKRGAESLKYFARLVNALFCDLGGPANCSRAPCPVAGELRTGELPANGSAALPAS